MRRPREAPKIVLLLLQAGALTACPASPSPPPAPPDPLPAPAPPASRSASSVVADLEALAARLSALEAAGCHDTCCRGPIPPWLDELGRPVPISREALRVVLASSREPKVLGLAVRWLASTADPEDLSRFDALLADPRPTGAVPVTHLAQAVQACSSLSWTHPTLGEVARSVATSLTGVPIASHAELSAWRAANPSAADSFEYWSRHVEALRTVAERNTELFVRVATMGDVAGHAVDFDDAEVVALAREVYGPPRLLRLLEGAEPHPDLAIPARAARFRTWELHHAGQLFDRSAAPRLLRLWETRAFADPHLHGWLAAAVIELDPSLTRRVASETIATTPSAADEVLVPALLKDRSAATNRVLARAAADPSRRDVRHGIFRALRAMGPPGLAQARELVPGVPRAVLEDEASEVIALAHALDPSLALPEASAIDDRERPPGRSKAPGPLSARALAARRDCVDRVLARLR
jgi:hypothetical protein